MDIFQYNVMQNRRSNEYFSEHFPFTGQALEQNSRLYPFSTSDVKTLDTVLLYIFNSKTSVSYEIYIIKETS